MNSSHNALGNAFRLSEEVSDALSEGRPVVALESMLIATGFPPDRRLPVAIEMEDQVRAAGATPATIAVLSGRVHIGLDVDGLTRITHDSDVRKVSIDNLPLILAAGGGGATTVATTCWAAATAGISVFATGGIGGVHRGANESFDVSADLHVLGSSSIAVVSAGAKSILDLPATLEVLETLGVSVATLGSEWFPGYYVRDTGLRTATLSDAAAAGEVLMARRALGLNGALLLAVPPPVTESINREEHDIALAAAEAQAKMDGISGRDISPVLLKALSQLTEGRSSEAGRRITLACITVAAEVAKRIAQPA